MFASRIGKLLYANRVNQIELLGGVEAWRVDKLISHIPVAGMTIGEVIFHTGSLPYDEDMLQHELVHVDQWRKFGSIGFIARYLGQFVWEFLKLAVKGDFRNIMFHAYYNIPLEVEARDAEHAE